MIQAGGDRDLLAEIARQADERDPFVGAAQSLYRWQRGVGAAIVDVYHFPPVNLGQGAAQAVVELGQPGRLIERRDDDGNRGLPGSSRKNIVHKPSVNL